MLSLTDILKRNPLLSAVGKLFGQFRQYLLFQTFGSHRHVLKDQVSVPVYHSFKHRFQSYAHGLLKLLYHFRFLSLKLIHRFHVTGTVPHLHTIFTSLQNIAVGMPGYAGVVIRCKHSHIYCHLKQLSFSRLQNPALTKSSQHSFGVPQFPTGQTKINLNYLSPIHISRIGHLRLYLDSIFIHLRHSTQRKLGIAQSVSKGIQNLLWMKSLKIAISYINVLHIVIIMFPAKIAASRIGVIAFRKGIRQLSAWIHRPGKHVRKGISALHSPLPCIDNGADLFLVLFYPAHVNYISTVQNNTHTSKSFRDPIQHFQFQIRQVKTALFQQVFPVLPGGPPQNDYGHIAIFRRSIHDFLCQRHLRIAHGPLTPSTFFRNILFLMTPGIVYSRQLLIQFHLAFA